MIIMRLKLICSVHPPFAFTLPVIMIIIIITIFLIITRLKLIPITNPQPTLP